MSLTIIGGRDFRVRVFIPPEVTMTTDEQFESIKSIDNIVNPEDMRVQARPLSGYKGESRDSANRIRLYLTARLDEYVEVDKDDVIQVIPLGGTDSPAILLFVKADANIQHETVISKRLTAEEFTKGGLGAGHSNYSQCYAAFLKGTFTKSVHTIFFYCPFGVSVYSC